MTAEQKYKPQSESSASNPAPLHLALKGLAVGGGDGGGGRWELIVSEPETAEPGAVQAAGGWTATRCCSEGHAQMEALAYPSGGRWRGGGCDLIKHQSNDKSLSCDLLFCSQG